MRAKLYTVIFGIGFEETDNYRRLPKPELKILLNPNKVSGEMYLCVPGESYAPIVTLGQTAKELVKSYTKQSKIYVEQVRTYSCLTDTLDIAPVYIGLSRETYEGNWHTYSDISEAKISYMHKQFIEDAHKKLIKNVDEYLFYLLPSLFTLTQAQNVYEAITGIEYQPANFRRKFKHLVKATKEYTDAAGHRPARLFKEA